MATVIGTRHIRQDGKEKVTGAGRYTADLNLTGMLHAKFRFADHPRARIVKIDTAAARALPGVFAVITQDDVPAVRYGAFIQDRTLFAGDAVRFEGEVVAAVAALTPEIAEQAAALIEVDVRAAGGRRRHRARAGRRRRAGARRVGVVLRSGRGRPQRQRRLALDHRQGRHRRRDGIRGRGRQGSVRRRHVTRRADRAARRRSPSGRATKVTVWSSTQVPFIARSGVAETLEMPENQVRIIVPYLGGGFGGKCEFHFEAHVAALARAAGRPVKLVFSRREEFIAPDHRREGMVIELETGVMNDGTLVARRARLVLDNGAYAADAPFFPADGDRCAVGPYRIPNVDLRADLAYTNTHAIRLGARAGRAAGVLGARAAHGRGRPRGGHRPGRVPAEEPRAWRATKARPARCSSRSAMRESLEHAMELIGYGKRPARGRGDRRRLRLVAVVRAAVGGAREAERRRLGHDRHRRPGVRHRRGDGAADPGRRGTGHAAGGLLDPLPGHRRRAMGRRGIGHRRRRSTTAARWSRRPPTCATSCSSWPRRRWRHPEPTWSWPTARCG